MVPEWIDISAICKDAKRFVGLYAVANFDVVAINNGFTVYGRVPGGQDVPAGGYGDMVTVTVNSNAGTPTGIVSLSVDGGAPLTASLSGGRAQFTLSNPSRGTHTVNATYPAQQNFGSSGDSGILQVN